MGKPTMSERKKNKQVELNEQEAENAACGTVVEIVKHEARKKRSYKMEKDFMQLSEEQLKEISGGTFNPDEFMKINDKEKAIEYLIQNGAEPGQGFYESYLAVWMKMKM